MKLLVLQHIKPEHLGILANFFDADGIAYEYVRVYEGDSVPKHLQGYSGLIILGGPAGVYEEDEYPFLRLESGLIRDALHRRQPLLGICLGAQLIAKTAGARVYKGDCKEIGWYPIEQAENSVDVIFNTLPKRIMVFQWHGDTFDIPRNAVRLAGSRLFPNQAFRLDRAYALQFHLEVTADMIRDWVKEYREELNEEEVDANKIEADTELHIADLGRYARLFYSSFRKILV